MQIAKLQRKNQSVDFCSPTTAFEDRLRRNDNPIYYFLFTIYYCGGKFKTANSR